MYSQNDEEKIISNYFGSYRGTALSLGENDGKTLSNVYACFERGWTGTCVEPSRTAFNKLFKLHENREVECFNVGISNKEGLVDFYDSDTHLHKGDTSLLSTFSQADYDKWKSKTVYEKTTAQLITFPQLMVLSKIKHFDLISIDCEGLDYEILSQIDLNDIKCRMLIVETNSIDDKKYIDYCAKFGFRVFHKNYMNLIFTK